MTAPAPITTDNFSSVLAHLIKSDNTMASRIQDLWNFALAHYEAYNDATYFTQLQNAGFRTVRTEAIRIYTLAHTNLACRRDPADKDKFLYKIDPKSTNPRVTKPSKTWTEYSGVGQALPLDIDKALPAFINKFRKALGADAKRSVKAGTEEHVTSVLSQLDKVAATLKA